MKKILVAVLAIVMTVCFGLGLTACKEDPVVLVDFNDQTIDIGYGEEYLLDLTVKDNNGNVYNISSSVTTGGEKVEITNGKFVASEKTDYIITYKFVKGEQTETRVVTAKVVAKKPPVVTIDGLDCMLVKFMDATLPTATAYDYFDGDLDYTVKVYKEVDGGDDVEVTINDGKFTVAEAGVYYAEYTAINSYNVSNSAKVYYTAKEAAELKSIVKVDQNTPGVAIYNNDIVSTFVAAGDDAIKDFTGGYTGNAVAFKIASNPNYRIKCSYSAEVVRAIGKEFNRVSMWIAVDGIESGYAGMMNAGHIEGYNSFQYKAMGTTLVLKSNQKQWIKISMSANEFADICGINEYLNAFYIYCEGTLGENAKVYVGDIEFYQEAPSTVAIIDSATYKTVWNADLQPTYVAAADLATAGLTGEYTGNAARFNIANNGGYRIINKYTVDELNLIAQDFDVISIWIAVAGYESGHLGIYDIKDPSEGRDAFLTTALGGQGSFTTLGLTNNTWKKVSLPINDYINLLKETTGDWARKDYTSYCPLFRIYTEGLNSGSANKAQIYIGDIVFEKTAA
ncbi:MAG: hypothetical protein IJV95_02880 [Clostridia bacterium]|nr:hypothetical protein [Clostridia bacterium]